METKISRNESNFVIQGNFVIQSKKTNKKSYIIFFVIPGSFISQKYPKEKPKSRF